MKEPDLLFKKFGKTYPAGALLFEEGQSCTGMYIIQKGKVRLFKKSGRKEITIDVLGEGDFFGEMACLVGHPRSINALVEEESHILLVEPEMLDHLFRETSGMGVKILGNLASRLQKAYGIIERLTEEQEQVRKQESAIP